MAVTTAQDKLRTHVGFLTLRCIELEAAVELLAEQNEELKKKLPVESNI